MRLHWPGLLDKRKLTKKVIKFNKDETKVRNLLQILAWRMKRQRFKVYIHILSEDRTFSKLRCIRSSWHLCIYRKKINIQRALKETWRYSGNAYWLGMLITFHNCGEWVSPSGWPRSCAPSSRRTWHPRQVSWGIVFKETFDEITIWNRGIKKTYITDGWHHRWLDG